MHFSVELRWTTGQPYHWALDQERCFSLFGQVAQMPDKTDAFWRIGGDYQDALILCG